MSRRLFLALTAVLAVVTLAPVALAHEGSGKTSVEGTLRTWHGDTFSAPVSVGEGIDTTIAGLIPLEQAPAPTASLAGKRVRASGVRRGKALAVSGSVQAAGPTNAVAAATGTKSVAVLLFNFAGDTRQPWTTAAVRNVVFDGAGSVNAYYQDASYGQMSMSGDVFGWFTIDATNAGCDYTTWANQARSKATAAGVPLANYAYTVYAFPNVGGCGWAGLAYLPGTASWINGSMNLRVVGHELGHNFGVHHASTLACTSAGTSVVLSPTCSANEYGDPFTIMGSAPTRHHNNWHRAQLGWLPAQTISSSGIYSLAPAELSTSTPRLLRVARGDGTYLNLEFRQPTGSFDNFSASDPAVTGVSARIAPDISSLVQSKLIDANPATSTFADAPFGAGMSLTDPVSGVSVTVVSVSPAGASVSVQFAPDTQAPTQPGALTATAQSSSSIRLSWSASSDNVGVTGYAITRSGVSLGTVTGTSYTDSGLSPATAYSYVVTALDAAGNASAAATAPATTQTLDASAPTAPGQLSATVAKGRKVNLSWGAATDNIGVVGYRVFRGGTQVAQVSGTSFRDSPGRGSFTYTVVAVDAAGNAGPASNSVAVRN